jgi:hypothetical protein
MRPEQAAELIGAASHPNDLLLPLSGTRPKPRLPQDRLRRAFVECVRRVRGLHPEVPGLALDAFDATDRYLAGDLPVDEMFRRHDAAETLMHSPRGLNPLRQTHECYAAWAMIHCGRRTITPYFTADIFGELREVAQGRREGEEVLTSQSGDEMVERERQTQLAILRCVIGNPFTEGPFRGRPIS